MPLACPFAATPICRPCLRQHSARITLPAEFSTLPVNTPPVSINDPRRYPPPRDSRPASSTSFPQLGGQSLAHRLLDDGTSGGLPGERLEVAVRPEAQKIDARIVCCLPTALSQMLPPLWTIVLMKTVHTSCCLRTGLLDHAISVNHTPRVLPRIPEAYVMATQSVCIPGPWPILVARCQLMARSPPTTGESTGVMAGWGNGTASPT